MFFIGEKNEQITKSIPKKYNKIYYKEPIIKKGRDLTLKASNPN